MEVLLEELYVDDGLEELLGKSPTELQVRQYPQAVAVALILRHSWRADDLACILERLGVTNGEVRGGNPSSPVAKNDTEASKFFQLIAARPSSPKSRCP